MKLFFKFIIVILIVVSVGLTAIISFFDNVSQTLLRTQVEARQLDTARQAITHIDTFLHDRAADVQALSARDDYIRTATSATARTDQVIASLKQFQAANPAWASLQLLSASGDLRASYAVPTAQSGSLAANPALAAVYRQALAGTVAHSDLLTDTATHQAAITFMAPLRSGSTVVGVLAGQVNSESLQALLQPVSTSQAYLVNRDGTIIIASQGASTNRNYHGTTVLDHAQHGQAGNQLIPDPKVAGQQLIASYAPEPGFQGYSGNGWLIILTTPLAAIANAAHRITWGLGAGLAGFVIAGITGVLWLLNRKVTRPIQVLTSAVTRVTLGDLSQTVPVNSEDEVGILGRNFNDMVRQLAATHRTLNEATQAAEDRRAQLTSSIQGLRQGFILTDTKGKMIMLNEAATTLLKGQPGTKPIKPTGTIRDLATLLPADLHFLDHLHLTLTKHESYRFPSQSIGGKFFNFYLSPVVKDEETIGAVALIEDVTEERILQRSRDEFFSIASHELRTPLTAIRGNTSLIKQFFPQMLKEPSVNEMIEDIHDSAIRLIDIVNDFLDASRLEQDKMKFELQPFAIEPLIETIIYELAGMSRDKGIALTFDQATLGEVPLIYADPNRVKQIVYNLVGNAMKFTQKGGVTINCLLQGNRLKVTVTDTGPGISPEGQQLLFHKFQQAGQSLMTRDNSRSTGLGLYICKLLIEHMGGEIRLEHTEVGKGSTFSFTLPLATPEQIKASPGLVQVKSKSATSKATAAYQAAPGQFTASQAPAPSTEPSTPAPAAPVGQPQAAAPTPPAPPTPLPALAPTTEPAPTTESPAAPKPAKSTRTATRKGKASPSTPKAKRTPKADS